MGKSIIIRLLVMPFALLVMSCGGDEAQAQTIKEEDMTEKLYITIGNQTLPVTLVKNNATEALMAALAANPITYEADDYGGFEKVGALGMSLPTNNQQLTTQAGDVILYSGNQIVLFYGSNSWSYTRLGRIEYESLEQLKSFLKAGQGRVSVTLSAENATDISSAKADDNDSDGYIALNGVRTQSPARGIYIKNGKKIVK
ncbi:MAG: hypothetical protein IKH08_07335 [Prevotella sp.]|nr:hypothetical protein [Prevotella sp.]